jgi:uncharacterized membrane protein
MGVSGADPDRLEQCQTRVVTGFRLPITTTRIWVRNMDCASAAARCSRHGFANSPESWGERRLFLSDIAVVMRRPDGSFALDREHFPAAANLAGATAVGLIAGLVLAVPMLGAAVGALLAGIGTGIATAAGIGISEEFVREVEAMLKPGTSALFVLDHEGDMDIILREIRGLGGTVLKTNVDVDGAKLIQSTLAGESRR